MSSTLYGAWRIQLTAGDPSPPTRIRIAGSVAADGLYGIQFQPDLDLAVTGDELAIDLEYVQTPVTDPPTWLASHFDAQTRFDQRDGLIVELVSDSTPHEFRPTIRLTCTSLDPTLNPIVTDNPYDFTVPHLPGG